MNPQVPPPQGPPLQKNELAIRGAASYPIVVFL